MQPEEEILHKVKGILFLDSCHNNIVHRNVYPHFLFCTALKCWITSYHFLSLWKNVIRTIRKGGSSIDTDSNENMDFHSSLLYPTMKKCWLNMQFKLLGNRMVICLYLSYEVCPPTAFIRMGIFSSCLIPNFHYVT